MSHRVIVRPAAEKDIIEAALWYEEQRRGLGSEFKARIDFAIQQGVANPFRFLMIRRSGEVRRILVQRFPYKIIFTTTGDSIVIHAVLHNKRHERTWQQRI